MYVFVLTSLRVLTCRTRNPVAPYMWHHRRYAFRRIACRVDPALERDDGSETVMVVLVVGYCGGNMVVGSDGGGE